jgi:signal peptidase I
MMTDYRTDLENGLKHTLADDARLQHIMHKIAVERNNQSAMKRKKYVYLVTSVLIIGLLTFGITLNPFIKNKPSQSIAETMPEIKTPSEVPLVNMKDLKPDVVLYDNNYDNMDRGAHDFVGWKVAADPVYAVGPNSRGDIVLFKNPRINALNVILPERSISRIVGLPGEKIKIEQGQIFIDGKKLNFLYGRAHRLGQDVEGLKMLLERDSLEEQLRKNIEGNIEQFQSSTMEEITIPSGHYFIVGDDWLRSNDSRVFGPIASEDIIGKVIGYVQNESSVNSPEVPKIQDGQTDDALFEAINKTPDLVKAVGVDGTEGYVRNQDLLGEMPKTPEEALEMQKKSPPGGRDIPLYAADGKTVIGVFHIQ